MRDQKSEDEKRVIGAISAGLGETQIEVVVCRRDGCDVVMLQLSTWHEALGWQVQKTIPFSANKIGQLQRLFTETRNQLEAADGAGAQVIDFAVRGPRPAAARTGSQPTTQTDDQSLSAIN
ncbi:MAG TPA: hypothetical protein VJ302_27380 [Blastocatellia bacterium]|nr:hypothetical protein [Blastocatellia bacterium]